MAAVANLYLDPGYESGAIRGTDIRTIAAGATDATAVVDEPVIIGERSLRMAVSANPSGGLGAGLVVIDRYFPAAAGSVWSASVLAGYCSPGVHGRMVILFLNSEGAALEFVRDQTEPGHLQPVPLIVEGAVAPVATVNVVYRLVVVSDVTHVVGGVSFDEAVFVNGPEAPIGVDGDRGGNEWTGPRFTSSAQQPEAPQLPLQEGWAPPYLWEPPFYQEAEEP